MAKPREGILGVSLILDSAQFAAILSGRLLIRFPLVITPDWAKDRHPISG